MLWAGIVLTATLLFGAPNVAIVDADTQGIELRAYYDYEYNVYISHAITECRWWPPYSVKVLTDTTFTRQMFEWSDYDLADPHSGDVACIWWDAQPEPSAIYFGIRRRGVIGRLYLPLMMKNV